jgi:hypothetical protein
MRAVSWCERAYPWSGGPVSKVQLYECRSTLEETPYTRPSELTSWTWRIDDISYRDGGNTAYIRLEMRQTIGAASSTFWRTYQFRWDGREAVLVRMGDLVRIDASGPTDTAE